MPDLVAQLDAIEQTGQDLVEVGRSLPVPGSVARSGSGNADVDADWQRVTASVTDHLLVAGSLLFGLGTQATSGAETLRDADRQLAEG
ncbi:MAG TPA: hypothetical protein VGC67_11505 [Cellulomonas sp.]